MEVVTVLTITSGEIQYAHQVPCRTVAEKGRRRC